MILVKPLHLVDIEGIALSPDVLFHRIYNPRKKTVLSNLLLTEMHKTFLGNVRFMHQTMNGILKIREEVTVDSVK